MTENPVIYISYSWTDEPHKERVLELATFLRESGVDVRLDRWHLKDGMEANAFMENMVAGKGADKVLIVCDREYAKKADERDGGVGTEAQIITSKIFGQRTENNYLLLVAEFDAEGKPYLPTFYTSRIWRNFSSTADRAELYSAVLRWCFGQQEIVPPEIGKVPNFITNSSANVNLGGPLLIAEAELGKTSEKVRAYFSDVLEYIIGQVRGIGYKFNSEPHDDEFMDSLSDLRALRHSLIKIIDRLCAQGNEDVVFPALDSFVESLFSISDSDLNGDADNQYSAERGNTPII